MTELPRSVAVAQTCPVKGDVKANTDEHLRLVEIAASEGAQIVVFPELSLTGYEIGLAEELAFVEHDERLAALVDASSSRSIVIVVGAPVRLAAKLHIVAFVVSPDRRLELYTKQRLGAFGESARGDGVIPPSEATVFHPGDRNPLVRFGDNLAAVAVCADIGEPSHPRRAAERGATSYLVAEGGPPGATGSGRVRCRRRNRDDTRLADTDGQASLIHLTHPDAVVAAIRDVVR